MKTKQRIIEVRESGIHGKGVFATRRIPKDTNIIEYKGERITYEEADRRPEPNGVTMLFIVDDETIIDGASGGNDARFINHSCAPNCEALLDDDRVYIWAKRDLEPGEELTYSYDLVIDAEPRKSWAKRYRCRCGAKRCRGVMLAPRLAAKLKKLLRVGSDARA